MFKTPKIDRHLKRLFKKIGMINVEYAGYDSTHGIFYFFKPFFGGNYLFTAYSLAEDEKNKYVSSFGTSTKLIDRFMAEYIQGMPLSIDKANEFNENAYGTDVPESVKSSLLLESFKTRGYEVLYVRDTTNIEKQLLKTIDVYLVSNTDDNITFVTISFIKYIDSDIMAELNVSDVNVPKFLIQNK